MTTVALSPKFQIVIPKDVRLALDLKPGQRVEARAVGNRVELTPIPAMKSARGMLAGIDTSVPNDLEDASWPGGVAADTRVLLAATAKPKRAARKPK